MSRHLAVLIRAALVALLISVLALANLERSTVSAARVSDLPAISMGTEPWIGYGPWWIAQAKGFFQKEGLNVNIVTFQQDADLNSALAAGRTQVANIATHTSIKLILNNGLKITPVLILDDSEGADAMLGGPSTPTVASLKGKTVAFEYGTTSDLLFHYALAQAHIDPKTVKTENIPAANAATALVTGHVDAAVTYEPYISSVAGKGHGVKVIYSSKVAPGLIGDFLVVNNSTLSTHPAWVRSLLRAWNDSMTYLAQNYKDGVAIMAKNVGSTPADLTTTLAGVKIYTIAQNKQLAKGLIQSRYAMVNGVLKSTGVVKTMLSPAKTLNFSFLP
jgi:NitT/TauT family transport system substrate-binding protein